MGTHKLYGAMSQVRQGMEDYRNRGVAAPTWDVGGPNHVRLAFNPCGCIYAFDVTPLTYDVTRMYGEICGVPNAPTTRYTSTAGVSPFANRCLVFGEPDNVIAIPGMNMLIIGEDGGQNQIDYMYTYDLATKTLTRYY